MAVTDQQKLDFLLKKIGYTKTKTGSVVGTGAISGTPKQPFAEAIPSPLVVPNSSLWNEAGSIPATPPGSDTPQVKVYLAASSGLRMTADSTSSGQRAYIAYSTYGNTSSTRLTNWIDTQFGASYLIKVYKGDPNSGGVALSAAGSGANDGWFFDYSAGVLNFNDTSVPSGVTDTNIYIVGYRYIGQTGAPTSGISTFSNLDLTVERNLDVGKQGGISTFRHNIDADGIIEGIAGENKIPSLYANLGALPSPVTYHGMFAHVHSTAKGYFSHAGGWYELVNKEINGVVGTGTETYNLGALSVTGNVSIGGTLTYEDVKNVDSVGIVTARAGIRVTGGVIEAQAGENKIPSLYAAMGNLPSAGSYHGMFAHVHATGRGYFAHAGNWLELVNREINGVVGTGTETYNIGNLVSTSSTATSLNVSGVTTTVTLDVNGDLDVDGHTNLDNVSVAGVSTFNDDVRFVGAAGTVFFDKSQNRLEFTDDTQLRFGSDGSLRLYHDSTDNNSYITNNDSTSHLYVRSWGSNKELFLQAKGNVEIWSGTTDKALVARQGGRLELYHSNTKVVQTDQHGIRIFGSLNSLSGVSTFEGSIDANSNIDLAGDLDVDGHTNLDNVSIAGVTTFAGAIDLNADLDVDGHTNLDNVNIAGVTTFAGAIDANGDLDVDGHTNLDNVSIAGFTTFTSGARFNGSFGVHDGTTGSNGQYLKATGAGVTWANFPTMRTSQTFTASSGQTTFSFTYNVGFLDVFVNGVKLTSSEFTATNGTSVVLSVGSFVGDIVELVSYFTTSYAAGASGLGNIVEDTTPQLGGNLDMFNKSITGTGNINLTGIITATNFVGDGSGLTGITASGSGVIVKDSGSTVGTAGTINFGDNLSVSPASAGIVTITASAGASSTAEVRANTLVVTGVSTLTNIDVDDFIDVGSNIQLGSIGIITALTFKGNGDFVELDVDGHTNLDNVNVAGVSTFAGTVNTDAISASGALSVSDIRSNALTLKNAAGSASYAVFSNGGSALLKHNNTDRLETSASGVTVTGTVAATSYTGDGSQLTGVGVQTSQFNVNKLDVSGISTFKGNVDVNADLDVDGHTNLDNVSVAGVSTFTGTLNANQLKFADSNGSSTNIALFGDSNDLKIYHNGSHSIVQDTGTGGLLLLGSFVEIANGSGSEKYFRAVANGAAELYHNNVKRLETTSVGVSIPQDLHVDGHTELDNVNIAGVVTATTFIGDGSGLTGITASGSGVVIKHDGSTVGTAGTINFGTNLDVSAISGGAVTITASGGSGSGISTISGVVNIANDLDVDGHTNLDNVSVAGVATVTGEIKFPDYSGNSNKISFGNSDDLQIFHSSGANYIKAINTQSLVFGTNNTNRAMFESAGHFRPVADSTYDLGINGTRWRNLYADTLYGDGSNLTGVNANVGITTNLSGSFTASAGSPSTINTFGYGSGDLVVEYTIYIKNGSDFQTQKLLAMRDGTTIHSTQFAVMFSSSLLVQCDATISSGNILLRATPETGVSGSTTYKIKREVM